MPTDDLPWPELGNVSRGATRGNQGQKGAISPPDANGRCLLQLRVQPGVLEVRLNRRAGEWYHILDNEVRNALRLTKTYWRKARRRQDYNARADQDHMELHEWLQQLKDKAMAQLETLIQKHEIPGPPYVMPDHLEFTFMRKFVERQALGIPHHPRLRDCKETYRFTPDYADTEATDHRSSSGRLTSASTTNYSPEGRPELRDVSSLAHRNNPMWLNGHPSSRPSTIHTLAYVNESRMNVLQDARERLAVTRANTQEAFARYISTLEAERVAQAEAEAAEEQRDEAVSQILEHVFPSTGQRLNVPLPSANIVLGAHSPLSNSFSGNAYPLYPLSNGIASPMSDGRSTPPDLVDSPELVDRMDVRHDTVYSQHFKDGRSAARSDTEVNRRSPEFRSDSDLNILVQKTSPGRKHPRGWETPDVSDDDERAVRKNTGFRPPGKRLFQNSGSSSVTSGD